MQQENVMPQNTSACAWHSLTLESVLTQSARHSAKTQHTTSLKSAGFSTEGTGPVLPPRLRCQNQNPWVRATQGSWWRTTDCSRGSASRACRLEPRAWGLTTLRTVFSLQIATRQEVSSLQRTYIYLQPLHVQEDPRRHFTAAHVIFLVLDTIHAQHLQPGPQPIWKDLAQSLWYAVSLNAFALCFIEVIRQWNLAFVGLLLFSWKKLDLHAGDLHQIQAWLQHKYHWQVPEHTTSNVLYIPMT